VLSVMVHVWKGCWYQIGSCMMEPLKVINWLLKEQVQYLSDFLPPLSVLEYIPVCYILTEFSTIMAKLRQISVIAVYICV
jgi:hypothetical protein